jgi:hypothetical protein
MLVFKQQPLSRSGKIDQKLDQLRRSTLIKSQQDPVLQGSVIEARTVQLQGRKKIEHKIVGPAGFNANANAIPPGPCQTDLIHHQLQLEHLLVEASGVGSPAEAAAQQHAQPPTL